MGKSLVSCFLTHGVDYRREKGMSCCSNGSDSPHRRGVTFFYMPDGRKDLTRLLPEGCLGRWPPKLSLFVGDPGPHLTHDSVGPLESIFQTSSLAAQPFLRGSRHSICSSSRHLALLAVMAMRAKVTSISCRRWTRATGCLVCVVLYTESNGLCSARTKFVGRTLTVASVHSNSTTRICRRFVAQLIVQ